MMELTTTHDAQRAMKIFFKAEVDERDRKEWLAITGQSDITTKVLWDTIRTSEGVAGLSGSGATVSASPWLEFGPNTPTHEGEYRVSIKDNQRFLTHRKTYPLMDWKGGKWLWDSGDGDPLEDYTAEVTHYQTPASPGPRPVCPKCGSLNVTIGYCDSPNLLGATCRVCRTSCDSTGTMFAQFFPASLNGEKQRQIDISNLRFYSAMAHDFRWQTDIIHHGVITQTLQAIADRLAGLSLAATTQGTPEGLCKDCSEDPCRCEDWIAEADEITRKTTRPAAPQKGKP